MPGPTDQEMREYLDGDDFAGLFRRLGWDNPVEGLAVPVEAAGSVWAAEAVAGAAGGVPDAVSGVPGAVTDQPWTLPLRTLPLRALPITWPITGAQLAKRLAGKAGGGGAATKPKQSKAWAGSTGRR